MRFRCQNRSGRFWTDAVADPGVRSSNRVGYQPAESGAKQIGPTVASYGDVQLAPRLDQRLCVRFAGKTGVFLETPPGRLRRALRHKTG